MQTINVQTELETKLEQRNDLARQTREALQAAQESRSGLASGRTTATEAATAQMRATVLQEALRETEEEIASLELAAERKKECEALEAKAREIERLAALAAVQWREADRLQTEAGQTMLEIAGRVLDAREALNATRRAFSDCLGAHKTKENAQALQRAASDVLRSCGVKPVDLTAVVENYSGDRWSGLHNLDFAFEETLREAYRKRGTYQPQPLS